MSYLQARIGARQRQAPQIQRNIEAIPAPVLGWNAKDELSAMDPRFAIRMDNYFPDGADIKLRRGHAEHVTGITGPVEYLHEASVAGNTALVAFANNSSYDVSSSGTIGTALGTGFTNNRWIGANAGASGGERALYTNGIDAAQSWDGTTWQSAGFVGPSKPNGITVANKRVWVYDDQTGTAWYLPPEAVTGQMSQFDLSSVAPDGGDLVAIGSLSIDGGQGPDDYTVFVMQSGRVIIYAGTDPGDPANWAMRGVWKAGRPIGNKCLVSFDKDLILITDVGFESVLRFTTGGGLSGVPISDNIRNAVSDASRLYRNNYGWNAVYDSAQRHLIFNIPILQQQASEQFVMNSLTGAWCRFTGVDSLCHAIFNGEHYSGVQGKVLKADTTRSDLGLPIEGYVQTAWIYFGIRGRDKHYKQMRVKIRSDIRIPVSLGIGTDFIDPIVTAQSSPGLAEGSLWDVAKWDVGKWGGGLVNQADWRGAHRKGFNASVAMSTRTVGADVQYLSSDVLYEIADI